MYNVSETIERENSKRGRILNENSKRGKKWGGRIVKEGMEKQRRGENCKRGNGEIEREWSREKVMGERGRIKKRRGRIVNEEMKKQRGGEAWRENE